MSNVDMSFLLPWFLDGLFAGLWYVVTSPVCWPRYKARRDGYETCFLGLSHYLATNLILN